MSRPKNHRVNGHHLSDRTERHWWFEFWGNNRPWPSYPEIVLKIQQKLKSLPYSSISAKNKGLRNARWDEKMMNESAAASHRK